MVPSKSMQKGGNKVQNQNEETILSFLPAARNCTVRNYIDKIEFANGGLNKGNDIEYSKKVGNLILEKCKSEEGRWTYKDYSKFRSFILKYDSEQIELAKESIITCLEASDTEALNELRKIASVVDFYPEYNRVYDKEEKKYNVTQKEINRIDIFSLISIFYSRYMSFISRQANTMMMSGEDTEILIETLEEIKESQEDKEQFMEEFNQTFNCIQTSSLYKSLLENFQNTYFDRLIANLKRQHQRNWIIEGYKQDREYNDYKYEARLLVERKRIQKYNERYLKKQRNQQ